MTTIALFVMYNAMLLGQQPQTVEEMTRVEYQATFGIDYIWPEPEKMGYSLELDLPWLNDFWPMRTEPLRVVNSDEPTAPEPVVRVRLAQFTGGGTPNCPGVCVSYSAQGAEGLRASTGKRIKGVQLVAAQVCATHPATFGAGMILGQAGFLGYQWHAPKIGTAIVERTLTLNWRSIIVNTLKYGTMFVLDLAIPGAFHLSTSVKTILATVHTGADDLPQLLAPGAPNAEPYRSSVIDPNSVLAIGPDRCQMMTFSAVYPGGPKTAGPVQLLP